jgi:CRISPR-associated protein Csx10
MNDIILTFRIHIDSDYHSGSGHRAGPLVDSGLLRDHEDTPILRGSKIAGLLRDGFGELKALQPVIDKMNDQTLHEIEARLFGTSTDPKLWRYSSARAAGRIDSDSLGRWGAQDVMRVRINPRTRRTDPQKLFIQEEGHRGLQFEFTATYRLASERDAKEALLLIAAARMVRHLGSARRRGRGACHFDLVEAKGLNLDAKNGLLQNALELFREIWLQDNSSEKGEAEKILLQNTVATSAPETQPENDAPPAGEASLPVRFHCIAYLEEPVLIAQRAETANAFITQPMISGGALLGAFATLAARQHSSGGSSALPNDFTNLFLRGDVSCSGLLPARKTRDNLLYPSIPSPLDIYVCSHNPKFDSNTDLAHSKKVFALQDEVSKKCLHPAVGKSCAAKLEEIDKPFIPMCRIRQYAFSPAQREEAHIEIVPATGRVKTGALYEFISLEAGQYFIGDLAFANAGVWQRFQNLVEIKQEDKEKDEYSCTLCLGKAKSRGHGMVRLFLKPRKANEKSWWIQKPVHERLQKKPVEGFIMTLLAETIIQDNWCRPYRSFEKSWVAKILGLAPDDIELRGQYARDREVDSFHGYRRMPRWRDRALVAGSTVGIKIMQAGWLKLADKDKNHDGFAALCKKLEELEDAGIGLRQNEGFGRVAFQHPIYDDDFQYKDVKIPAQNPNTGTQANPQAQLAIFKQSWQKELKTLLARQESRKEWQSIKKDFKDFAPLVRTIFVSREFDLEQIKRRLEQFARPNANYLWEKQVGAREKKEPKIKSDTGGYNFIHELLGKLNTKANTFPNVREQCWRSGLEILAEQLDLRVKKAQSEEEQS